MPCSQSLLADQCDAPPGHRQDCSGLEQPGARTFWVVIGRLVAKLTCMAIAVCDDPPDGRAKPEAWRLRQLALDPSGALHRARAFARRAAKLARGPDQAYRAAELLVLIEHESGRHARELQEARQLVKLRPESPRAWLVLRGAEACRARRLQPANAPAGTPAPPSPPMEP